MVKKFREYDLLCKKEFWKIAIHNKYQMLKLIFYYKPIQLVHTMQYLMHQNKRSLTYSNLYDQAGSLLTNEQRTKKSAFFRPFTFIPLFIIALGFGIAGIQSVRKAVNAKIITVGSGLFFKPDTWIYHVSTCTCHFVFLYYASNFSLRSDYICRFKLAIYHATNIATNR